MSESIDHGSQYPYLTHPQLWTKYGAVDPRVSFVFAAKWSPTLRDGAHPQGSHTIHGLWPNLPHNPQNPPWNMDELYTTPLDQLGGVDLLTYLHHYWQSDLSGHTDGSFWQHQYTKHGRSMPLMWPNLQGTLVPNGVKNYFLLVCQIYQKLLPALPEIDRTELHQVEFHLDQQWNMVQIRTLSKAEHAQGGHAG